MSTDKPGDVPMDEPSHVPVMLDEVMSAINIRPGGVYIDATFGAGGFSRRILEADNSVKVIGIDKDKSAEKFAAALLRDYEDRFEFKHMNFSQLDDLAITADGIVFDIGVSSMQLDTADRGFSFAYDGDLDMRMNQEDALTAEDVINTYKEKELADILYYFGGERKSRRIAKGIVEARAKKRIKTTKELADIVRRSIGFYRGKISPATRTFQAIRIEVNNELDTLRVGLEKAALMMKPGGVMVVISFHSGEDRIVKYFFKELAKNEIEFTLVRKKAMMPSRDEVLCNPRSRSAKMRYIVRGSDGK